MAEILSTGDARLEARPNALRAGPEAPPQGHETLLVDTEKLRRFHRARVAFEEFLGVPVAITAGLIVLGALLYALELADPAWLHPLRALLMRYFFQTSDSTRAMLDMVGAGGLTTASIIITLLLLVLQQSAGNMGNMIYDQFLQRRTNQIYVGLVIGVTVMALFLSGSVTQDFNPALGAAVVVSMVIVLVVLLLFLLYFTIEQMRPEEIIHRIHQRTLAARQKQIELARRTRNEPQLASGYVVDACSQTNGYVVEINLEEIAACLGELSSEAELVVLRKIGAYVHYHDCLAEAHAARREDALRLAESVGRAFRLATMREMTYDPAFGLDQLEMMAWTEISSAKHNPETGLQVIYSLRDILARWADEDVSLENHPLAVVYTDRLPPSVIDSLESLAVISADGMQHQCMTEILLTVERLFDRLPPELQQRAEEMLLRIAPAVRRLILTHHLDVALGALTERLECAGRKETAAGLRAALAAPAEPGDEYS